MKQKTKKTVIITGYSCNNNCVFCCHSDRRIAVKDTPTWIIRKKILQAKKSGSDYLEITGGEPTIRKDIISIVKFAKELGFRTIMIATNGRMLSNKRFAEKIIDAGANSIVFSIHGHNAELHDRLTRVSGSFDQMIKGIRNLQEIGFSSIGSNTTIIKQNMKKLPDIANLINSLGITNSEFIFVDPTHGIVKRNFGKFVPKYEEASPYVNQILGFAKEKGIENWSIRYFPMCFIEPDFNRMISELKEVKNFYTLHSAPDFLNDNVSKSRKNFSRKRIGACNICVHKEYCEGFWKEVLKRTDYKGNTINTAFLVVTDMCNLNCRYCPVKKTGQKMTFEKAKKAVDMAIEMCDKEIYITFFGGEPLLEKSFLWNVSKYAKENSMKKGKKIIIGMVTNGTLIDEDVIESAKEYDIKFGMSIDGNEKHQKKNRKGNADYEYIKLIKNYKKLKDEGIEPEVATVIMPDQAEEGFEIYKYIYSLRPEVAFFSRAFGVKWTKKQVEDYKKSLHKINDFIIRKMNEGDNLASRIAERKIRDIISDNTENRCSKGINVTFRPNGDIMPCHFISENMDDYKESIIGNIDKGIDFQKKNSFAKKVNKNAKRVSLDEFGCENPECARLCMFRLDDANDEDIKRILKARIIENESNISFFRSVMLFANR